MLDNPKTELKASIQVASKVNQDKGMTDSVRAGFPGEDERALWGHSVVTPHPDVQCSVLDGEAVLLNLETGAYFTLNRAGTVTWELFNGARTLDQIHSAICERFEGSEEVARQDLLALVEHLDQEGLIQPERR